MQYRWALGHKERWPRPEEKVVVLRKAQLAIFIEAGNLRLDSGELTLQSRDGPAHPWRPFRFRAFHTAPHVRSHPIVLSRKKCVVLAGDDEAPPALV